MALKLAYLTLTVEAAGARWTFAEPDRALARLGAAAQKIGLSEADSEDLPAPLLELLPDLFLEGVRGWDDVQGPDGNPLPFNSASARAIPTEAKITAALAYLTERTRLGEAQRPPAEPPTDSTPPGDA